MIAEASLSTLAPTRPEIRRTRTPRLPTGRRMMFPAVRRRASGRRTPRLGIITASNGVRDEQGRILMGQGNGRLMNELLKRFPGSRICLPVIETRWPNLTCPLEVDEDAVVALPMLTSTMQAQKYFYPTRRILRQFADSVDMLYIRLAFPLPRALKGLQKPKLLHVVGDTREVVRVSCNYRGLTRLMARGLAFDMERTFKQLVAEPDTRTVTNGEALWEKLGCRHGRAVVSSCLRQDEMQPKSDFRLAETPRLLFVGYLRPEKGVPSLLDAFHRIRRHRHIKLTVVGSADRPTPAEQIIHKQIEESPYRDDIEMTGMVPFGPELFELYRRHDVYVSPSLTEGTPRTLIEARSFGCPVVATRVGGVPTSVDDGRDGLLVEPNDPAQLAAALSRVLDDEPLRQRLIEGGLRRAGRHSLEQYTDELARELELLSPGQATSPARAARMPLPGPHRLPQPTVGMAT